MNRVVFEGSVEGIQRYDFKWRETERKLASRVIPFTLMALKAAAPVSDTKTDAGRLKASIGARVESGLGEGGMLIRFVSTAPYAQYVIEGTQSERLIVPTEGVMALRWNDGGEYRFAKAIRRKPTAPNPFNERAAMLLTPFFMRTFGDSLYLVAV